MIKLLDRSWVQKRIEVGGEDVVRGVGRILVVFLKEIQDRFVFIG
jgi:hypothetical protein